VGGCFSTGFAIMSSASSAAEDLIGFSELTSKDVSLDLTQDGMILYPKGGIKDEHEFVQRTRQYAA
jgi:hypothetical protein